MLEIVPIFNYIDDLNFTFTYSYPIILEEIGEVESYYSNTLFENLISIDTVEIISNASSIKIPVIEIRYRTSQSKDWTFWTDLYSDIKFDIACQYFIQFRVQRGGTDPYGVLNISDIIFHGTYNLVPIDSTNGTIPSNSSQIFSPVDVYKVFSLSGFQVVSTPSYDPDDTNISILYRVSQDRDRTWTKWFVLTDSVLSTLRPDPLKFFNIQYHVINNSDTPLMISQINLLGDFINISSNYSKSNKLGIKSTCVNNTDEKADGVCDPNVNPYTSLMNQESCDPAGFWTPYDKNKAIQLYEFQAQMALDTLGWSVDYYKTDVDRKGRDVILNEYQLYNINCVSQLKILVPGNKFPDNQIEFNGTDLQDLQLFEIHILRNEFKNQFGINERPAVNDIVYICERNRLYRVEHAGSQRSFMNSTIFYKVQLRKYNQQGNTRVSDSVADNQLRQLVSQTTFAELIGADITDQLNRVANKPLNVNLSHDPIRESISAKMIKYDLISGTNHITNYYYDMTKVPTDQYGVTYNALDVKGDTSSSRTLDVWFSLTSIGYKCNLFTNRVGDYGYSLDVDNKGIYFSINSDVYNLFFPINIGTWYCGVVIFDQTTKRISMYLYTTIDSIGSGVNPSIQLVSSVITNLVNTYSWDSLHNMGIYGSKAYTCHIRLWREALDINSLVEELTIQRLDDAQLAIVADNVLPIVKAKTFVSIPDPKQLPDSSKIKEQKLNIKVDKLTTDGNDGVEITDQEWFDLDSISRLHYLESKYNIGISDYKFKSSTDDELSYIINNFTVLSDPQFNSFDDTSKILFLNRLLINNPSNQWVVPGIVPYGIIPDGVFSLMDENVVNVVISNGYRLNNQQWASLTTTQMYDYLQIAPRNKLVPTSPKGNTETTSQYLARLNTSFSRLQKVQTY